MSNELLDKKLEAYDAMIGDAEKRIRAASTELDSAKVSLQRALGAKLATLEIIKESKAAVEANKDKNGGE